jgi:hypothetical protein
MALGMMLPGMASGFIQEFRLRKLLYLGVSSHYSWINSVKILDFPVTLERNLKLVNSSDYEVLDV